jgi:large subunit ribosomal protein L29
MAKKTKKHDEMTKMSDTELKKHLDETYKRMFALNLQKETLQLQNHREIPSARREIARVKTLQRQRQISKGGAS